MSEDEYEPAAPRVVVGRVKADTPAGRHDDIGDRARSRRKPFGEKPVERRRRPRLDAEVDYGHADGEEQSDQDYDGTMWHRLAPSSFLRLSAPKSSACITRTPARIP